MSYHSDVAHNMYRFYTSYLCYFPLISHLVERVPSVLLQMVIPGRKVVWALKLPEAGLRVCYASLIQLPPTTSELSSPVTVTVPTLIYNPYFRRTSTHNYIFRLLQPLN